MKQTIQFALAIAVSAAAMFAYMYEPLPEGAVQEVAHQTTSDTTTTSQAAVPQQSATQTASQERELTAAELADIDPASIDWAAMRQRYRHVTFGKDPMLASYSVFIRDFKAEEIVAYNKLRVLPFNPTVEENCSPLLLGGTEDFPQQTQMNCVPVLARDEQPYRSLSLEELRDLVEANNDAEAAAIASQYFPIEESERIGFAIRAAALSGKAAALSGKSGPIHKASRSSIPRTDLTTTADGVIDEVGQYLVLENIAALMGDPRAVPENQSSIASLKEAGLNQAEIDALQHYIKESAKETLERMGMVQRELTGATSIMELTNA